MPRSKKDNLSIVISGSFRKHYDYIREMIQQFEDLGIQVLAPKHSEIVNTGDEFILLEADESICPKTLECEHLNAISQACALYLCNVDGYIGPSSAMELGWARAFGKMVFTKEPCDDVTLRHFTGEQATPEQVKELMLEEQATWADELNPHSSLRVLQTYVKHMVVKRGFKKETKRDKLLLMLEEFGELAGALRNKVGLKVDKKKAKLHDDVKLELADILFYLLDLSETCNIDLFEAFLEKERLNSEREWGNI